jgi:hypothetical protein
MRGYGLVPVHSGPTGQIHRGAVLQRNRRYPSGYGHKVV